MSYAEEAAADYYAGMLESTPDLTFAQVEASGAVNLINSTYGPLSITSHRVAFGSARAALAKPARTTALPASWYIAEDGHGEPTIFDTEGAGPFGDRAIGRRCDMPRPVWDLFAAAIPARNELDEHDALEPDDETPEVFEHTYGMPTGQPRRIGTAKDVARPVRGDDAHYALEG